MAQAKKSKETQSNPGNCYFIATALCIYVKEDDGETAIKQRHLNVLLESDTAAITKSQLNTLHRSAMQRLNAENGVTPDQIKDIVIMNVSYLGQMLPEQFHENPAPEPDSEQPNPLNS